MFPLLGTYDLKYKAYADWDFNLRCFGDRRVRPAYVPVLVADFESGGISGAGDPESNATDGESSFATTGCSAVRRW